MLRDVGVDISRATICGWVMRVGEMLPSGGGHAQRRFMDGVKLNRQDAAAIHAVKLMDDLFAIDREAREAQMDLGARHRLRQEKAPPVLDQIREHILTTSKTVLPQSAAGKACSYTLALWKKLIRFLEYPQLELSNNLAESSMRPLALGRKNWIHLSSEQAGPRIGAILSNVARPESRRRADVPAHYRASGRAEQEVEICSRCCTPRPAIRI